MILAASASAATSLELNGRLNLDTAAAAAAFARAAPCVTDLAMHALCDATPLAAATLLGLMGGRLQSLKLYTSWDVEALAALGGACNELQHLVLQGRLPPGAGVCWMAGDTTTCYNNNVQRAVAEADLTCVVPECAQSQVACMPWRHCRAWRGCLHGMWGGGACAFACAQHEWQGFYERMYACRRACM